MPSWINRTATSGEALTGFVMIDIDSLSKICARAIADANITNCYPDEARPVVEAILAAVGIVVQPDAVQEYRNRRMTPQSRDSGHCEVCGWPLADSQEHGCVPGDCSYRPEAG